MSSPPTQEQQLVDDVQAKFGDRVKAAFVKPKRFKLVVEGGHAVEVAAHLHEAGFDHVASVAGVDYPKDNVIEVVYHAASYSREELTRVVGALAVRVPRDAPTMPTLTGVWGSAEFHERETHDLLGVVFEGHPNLERLLLPEDWSDIPPLRRDFVLPGREGEE